MSPAASMEGLPKVQSQSNLRKPSTSDQKNVKMTKSIEVLRLGVIIKTFEET